MELIRFFGNLGRHDAAIAGGKGASLGEMTQAGIPVPPGFVVLSDAFERFLKETELDVEIDAALDTVNHKEIHTVENASERIQALILDAEMPKDIAEAVMKSFEKLGAKWVAVRSSATAEDSASAAWAGQLDSFLNTPKKDLLKKVQHCWASLFTPRAIFYRFEKDLHKQKISVAVVVQKMVDSEVSGIAFSVHPVTQDYNQLIIEAGYGLGEAIVSGQITPDSYVVEKKEKTILEARAEKQERRLDKKSDGGNEWVAIPTDHQDAQKLTGKRILELSDLIIRIEDHYGFPCDIEWAFEKGKFYITQSRPITTLSKIEINKPKTCPIADVDWIKFLERSRSCFIYHPFIEAEFFFLPKVTGFGYTKHLYKWVGDKGTHYRSATELQRSLEHYSALAKNHLEKIKKYCDACMRWDDRAKELTKLFEGKKGKKIPLTEFKKYYNEFVQILLFTVAIPYLCMSGIDYALGKGEKRGLFEKALKILSPLRGFTAYPKLERSMLAHFWSLISNKSGIKDLELIDKLTPQEIESYIDGGSLPEISELEKRKKWCVFWHDPKTKSIIFEYDSAVAKELTFLQDQGVNLKKNEIVGKVAYPGIVSGAVCRVDKAADMAKYKIGDIIVSICTSPDLMAVLSTCGAIVTDEGGIVCHAAIVSREMKKPCVIGTKIATKILKDGDLVEVDADRGVVQKIEESRPGQEPKLDIDYLASLKWHYVHKRIRTPFYMTLLFDGVSQHNNPKLKFPYEVRVCVLNGDIAFPDEDWQRLKKIILGQLEIDQGFLLKLLHESYKENEAIESLAKRYQEIDTAKISPQKRLGLWKEYVQKSRAFGAYIILPLFIEPEMEAKLKKAIQKKFHGDKAEEVFQVLTTPTKPGAILQEEMNLLKLAMDKSKGKNISQALQKHLIDFAWIKNNSFDGSFYTAREIEKRIQDAIRGNAQRKFQEHQEKIKEQKKKFDAFRKIVGDEPKMAGLIDTLQESIYFRSWRTERYYRNAYFLQGLFAGTAKALGLTHANDLFYLTPQEILEQLEGMGSLDKKKIEGRKEAYLLWTEENGTNIYSGPIVEKAQKKIRFLEIDQSCEIKGQTAYPGVVSGKARIIFSVKELHKVQPGEILVTPSTTPNYVPVLKRVKGIITEEGGVLSHASVISRELKIPCVIGTKIATQILKDGDLVEVDADKGVVRKIEDDLRRIAPIGMDDLGSKNWKKNWAGGWSMLSCAYLGHQYTRQLKEAIGISLNEALFISHRGISSCYFIDEHKKTFGEHLVRQAELDPRKIKEWAKSLVRTTDGILALIETLKKQDATYDNFKAFLGKMYEYGVPHRIVKMAVDYLPEVLLKKYLTDLTKARVHAEPVYAETENYMRHIAQKIYERIGLRPELVLALTPDQFEACLHSGTAPSEKNLIEQYENSALYMKNGAKEFVVGEAAVGKLEKALTDKLTSANALIGQGAYPGKVTGRVVVVLDPTKGKTFSAGDILVTGMTRPEYLPFIERSAGFVTDAGGILSHAAITARELRKPAVIGTDIATQILKDGDLVEVDADKGVVRRVEEGEGNPLDIVEKVISDKNWIFLVGRPYTLFGASLYQRWFDPPQISKLFGISIPDNLYVEEHPNVVRRYVKKEQLDAFSNAIANLVKNDLKKAKQMAKKGLELSEQAKRYIKKTPFSDLNAAVDFLVELALHAAVFSYFAYPVAKEKNDMELVRMLEGLRSISYYPKVVEKIINPLARKKAGADYNFMTISEIMAGDRSKVVLRKKASGQGKRFLYSKIDGEEDVQWVENVMGVIEKLERVRIGNSVKGQVAYPGKIVGRVRRVLTSNTDIEFDEGDILVVVTSNPTLMPLIRRCGAIVSDEGGITSHAAIVSRELKKPCVIGTKFATHSFKDGDLVEVDADKGVVKIIKNG